MMIMVNDDDDYGMCNWKMVNRFFSFFTSVIFLVNYLYIIPLCTVYISYQFRQWNVLWLFFNDDDNDDGAIIIFTIIIIIIIIIVGDPWWSSFQFNVACFDRPCISMEWMIIIIIPFTFIFNKKWWWLFWISNYFSLGVLCVCCITSRCMFLIKIEICNLNYWSDPKKKNKKKHCSNFFRSCLKCIIFFSSSSFK